MASQQIVNLPFLYINNMQVSTNATTPNTKLDVAAGQCRDSTNVFDIIIQAGTINAATNGANGLDTGSLAANTWYYIYAIGNTLAPSYTSEGYNYGALLLSTSTTAPLLPAGYDVFRLIGSRLTSGSSVFLPAYVKGNSSERFTFYDAPITELSAAGSATYAAIDLSSSLPATSTLAYLNSLFAPNTVTNTAKLRPTGSSSTTNVIIKGSVVSQTNSSLFLMNTSAARSIDWITSSASDALTLYTAGYVEYL